MNIISKNAFKSLTVEEVSKLVPMIITVDGTPSYIIGSLENTICMDDLALPVRAQLKSREALARANQPEPRKIYEVQIANNELPEQKE